MKNEWLDMEDAPRDGTPIIGLVHGDEVEVRWANERQCMLAGIGGGNGYFGEGWEDTYNGLISAEPTQWKPTLIKQLEVTSGEGDT